MTLYVKAGESSYPVYIEVGITDRLGELFDLNRKVLIVTDKNVSPEAVSSVQGACADPRLLILEPGEKNKSFSGLERLCRFMLENGFTRTDAALALGGGVIGDLTGLAAALYMRGIDFYNVPTTLLSQVDSSIGGKTAIDLGKTKNAVGAFKRPKGVAIDPKLLLTLPKKQLSNGLAEAIKMAATCDERQFCLMEREDFDAILPQIIEGSLRIKKDIVEKDEKESGLRRVLNFGHTIGHGIEAVTGMEHGECVALGMTFMCAKEIRPRLERLLKKAGLPTRVSLDADAVLRAIASDKKAEGNEINYVFVENIGSFSFRKCSFEEFSRRFGAMIAGEG
ncbi:MAG: 3-dehydroquinate synthase [Clostridia bacterium]|nr:3-dehydroquinate synthase [Clostridia bacterium]